jgi:hypothetical protein
MSNITSYNKSTIVTTFRESLAIWYGPGVKGAFRIYKKISDQSGKGRELSNFPLQTETEKYNSKDLSLKAPF